MRLASVALIFSLCSSTAYAQLATPILGADQANTIQGYGATGSYGLLTDGEIRPLPPSEDAAPLPDTSKLQKDVAKDAPDVSQNVPDGEDPEEAKKLSAQRARNAQHGQASSSHAAGVGGQNNVQEEPAIPLPAPKLNPEMEILIQLQNR